jgi:hypothetical protein
LNELAARDHPLSTHSTPTTLAPPIRIDAAAADRAAKEERAAWDAVEPEWQGKLQSQLAGGAEDDATPWDQPMTADAATQITGRFRHIRSENCEFQNNS